MKAAKLLLLLLLFLGAFFISFKFYSAHAYVLEEPNDVNGIFFNGIDQYGTAAVNINADVMPTATIEFWAKPEATTNGKRQDVVGHDFWGFGRAVTVEGSDGNWGVFTGHGVWEPTKVESNQWQHIAVTYTPDDIIFKKTYNGVTETYSFHQMTGDTPSISSGRDFVSFG